MKSSSHASEGVRTPSPQTSKQDEGEVILPPEQKYPGTAPKQFAKHLSTSELSPSSQISP